MKDEKQGSCHLALYTQVRRRRKEVPKERNEQAQVGRCRGKGYLGTVRGVQKWQDVVMKSALK